MEFDSRGVGADEEGVGGEDEVFEERLEADVPADVVFEDKDCGVVVVDDAGGGWDVSVGAMRGGIYIFTVLFWYAGH